MGILQDVEERIDMLLRRVFPKRDGERLQPIEIVREMALAMDRERTLSVDAVYVPNVYRVALHPDDLEALMPVANTVRRDAVQYLLRTAERRGVTFAGPVQVAFHDDSGVGPGCFRLTYEFREEPSTPNIGGKASYEEGPEEATRIVSLPLAAPNLGAPAARLDVTDGPDRGCRLELAPGRTYSIGRSHTADLALSDLRVSKRHAELRYEGGSWWIIDLDSTNGTRRNGRSVTRERLEDGDGLTLGATTLLFMQADAALEDTSWT